MPVILKINPQKRVVHSTFFGVITDKEFLGHSEAILSHPDFRPEYDEIVDLTMVTDPQISRAALQQLAGKKSVFLPYSKHAIVAPKDLAFEMAEEFRRMAEVSRSNLKVVRSAAEAYDFVGVK
jgi:hypothetical protein